MGVQHWGTHSLPSENGSETFWKTDRIVIETSWGWGEAVVRGLVMPDHVEVGKADGRILDYQVAAKKVVSNFDCLSSALLLTSAAER